MHGKLSWSMPNFIPILEVPPGQPLIHVGDLGETKSKLVDGMGQGGS
jgi:hypothetical protein